MEEFKPKSSDTHRSDKKRNVGSSKKIEKKTFKKGNYLKVKKSIKFLDMELLTVDYSEDDVTVTFKRGVGLEHTVNITQI